MAQRGGVRASLSELRIEALDLDIVRLPGDRFSVGGFVFDPNEKGEDSGVSDWILAQGEVVIRDARIRYSDRRGAPTATDFELAHVNLQLENVFGSHIVGLQAQPTSAIAGPIDLRARFRHSPFSRPSDHSRWTGEVFGVRRLCRSGRAGAHVRRTDQGSSTRRVQCAAG